MNQQREEVSKLEGRINSLTEQLLHAFEELDLLHSVCEIFSSPKHPQDINTHILFEAMEILSADLGWMVYRDKESSPLEVLTQSTDARTLELINQIVVREVIRTGNQVWTDNLQEELGASAEHIPRAFLCVPLRTQNEVLGAICMGKMTPGAVFTAGDLKLVQILCAPCANAILQERVERTNALRRYVSPQLAETILAGQDIQLRNKRAELTIFFCQLKGFSEATEEMEPEELIDILNEYLSEMAEIIFEHEGTLDKFILGSIFGFFGDPVAQEDHPLRAIRMAIAMQNRFTELQDKWLGEGYKPFGLGISINTGYVTVGNVGSPNRRDYTAIGKNVILAARLAELAEHGQIIMGQRTHNKVKDAFPARFLGSKEIGKQPVRFYEVEYSGQLRAKDFRGEDDKPRPSSGLVRSEKGPAYDYFLTKGKLSHYRILSKLGEGGMGQVYKAEDLRLDRIVALKILSQAMSDPIKKRRFVREAKALSALNHPNIATIYEIDERDNISFIAMEYIEGKTLTEIVKSQRLSILEVLNIAIPVAEALSKAHDKKIIHRDIKPTNIIVSSEGYVKVLDFGLAKVTPVEIVDGAQETLHSSVLTQAGTVWGTVSYMSPEQARGIEVDQRSDIFSFGIVLYELVAGRRPFLGNNHLAIVHAIIAETPPPLSQFNPDATGDLERIVTKALVKEPDGRYQGMRDMLVDLKVLRQKV